jgi:tetratricopeptide (TPR) repeat protein
MMHSPAKHAGLSNFLSSLGMALALAVCPLSVLASASAWQESVAKGDAAINQQSLKQAEDYFRQAVKEVGQAPHSVKDMADCLNKLANALTLEGKIEEAEKIYQRSIKQLQQSFGLSSTELLPTLFALGSIYESEGDVSAAMDLYQRAFKINEKHYGPYSPGVADSLHHLGRASSIAGQPEKAERHYKQALSILEKEPGLGASKQMEDLLTDYSDLLRKKDNIGQALISDFQREILKDTVESREATKESAPSAWQHQMSVRSSLAKQTQANEDPTVLLRGIAQPSNSSKLSPIYNTMTDTFYDQSHYAQGEPLYKRMIAIDVEALGPNHPAVADDLSGLALLYIAQHRYQEAEPLLTRALSIYEGAYGNDNKLVIKTRTTLASVYNHLKNPDQAAGLYQKALIEGRKTLGPNNLETAQILNELAFLYFRQGKLEDASTFYQWAIASTEAAAGPESPLLAACLNDYAHVLKNLGRSTEADQMSERAKSILAKVEESP